MVFPNTAGYLMHFLESRSHQFPLARNVFVTEGNAGAVTLDDIDDALRIAPDISILHENLLS